MKKRILNWWYSLPLEQRYKLSKKYFPAKHLNVRNIMYIYQQETHEKVFDTTAVNMVIDSLKQWSAETKKGMTLEKLYEYAKFTQLKPHEVYYIMKTLKIQI